MKHAHRLVLLACVAACFAVAHGCATLSRLGGAGAGAGLGAAVGGPLGAVGGAVAGDAVANAVVPQPVQPTTVVNNTGSGTVHVGEQPWPMWVKLCVGWAAICTLFGLYRFRSYIAGGLYGVLKLSREAISSNLKAAIVGGPQNALRARETVAAVKSRRRYPNRPVSPQNPEPFEGAPHA